MLFYKLSNAFLFTLQEMNEETYPTKREVQNIFENLQKCQTGRGMFCSLEG